MWNKLFRETERHKLIHTDKKTDRQTDRQTDGQTDRHKSFIDMRYYTEQYSKSNSIKENRIESNQIDLKYRIEQNGDQISRKDKIKEHKI